MKILCTSDLHIGRRASKIPHHLDGLRYSCSAAWEAVVDAAMEHEVDLVVMGGDVVDRSNRFFEAYGPLERGLRRLADAGIETCAVSGNHDFDVLPRLADSLGSRHFHLLGRGGRWERISIVRDNQAVLHVDGWSFPREHVSTNPLGEYPFDDVDGVPVIGLLHADLDQGQSRYCPVPLADLQRRRIQLWLLGHVHSTDMHPNANGPITLYPGSPYAMDPGEGGVHGPWLVEMLAGHEVALRQLPLSPVRYVQIDVDLTGVEDRDGFERRVVDAVRAAVVGAAESPDAGPLECLCCRLILTGHTRIHRHLPGWVGMVQEDLAPTAGHVSACIESIEVATRPAVDLARLAGANDPPGELARLLLALEGAGDEIPAPYRDVAVGATTRLQSVHRANPYGDIGDDPLPGPDVARRCLQQEAWLLLATLLAQKDEA